MRRTGGWRWSVSALTGTLCGEPSSYLLPHRSCRSTCILPAGSSARRYPRHGAVRGLDRTYIVAMASCSFIHSILAGDSCRGARGALFDLKVDGRLLLICAGMMVLMFALNIAPASLTGLFPTTSIFFTQVGGLLVRMAWSYCDGSPRGPGVSNAVVVRDRVAIGLFIVLLAGSVGLKALKGPQVRRSTAGRSGPTQSEIVRNLHAQGFSTRLN